MVCSLGAVPGWIARNLVGRRACFAALEALKAVQAVQAVKG
jgi:hypothetical protein